MEATQNSRNRASVSTSQNSDSDHQITEAKASQCSIYDPLLDYYEPGASEQS